MKTLKAGSAIAEKQAQASAPAEVWDYRIVVGDTLIGLHARLMRPEADWRAVQRLNRIADPHRLRPDSTLRIPVAMLREEPVSAEVLHAHGEVFVERAGAARELLQAAALLRAGDVVSTGAQSSTSIRFVDGSRALLGPAGRLRVERQVKLGGSGIVDTRLRLDAGGIETRVVPARPAPRFELRTPVANLGVRGTEFRARVDGERVLAEVLEGRVAVGARALDAGFGTVATVAQVAPPSPLAAPPDLSGLPTKVERLPLQFSFAPAPGAAPGAAPAPAPARYRAQIFDTSEPERLLLDSLFDAPRAAWPDSPPDGNYELRVRAADATGVEGRAARLAFTLKARPEPPFQLRPRAGERLVAESVGFAWSRHPEAARYRLQVAARPDFSEPQIDRSDLAGTEFSAPLPLGTWHWRVASVRASGDTGPWGDAALLLRVEPPPPPAAPAAAPPEVGDGGLTMRWAAAPLPGVRYQVQVARDAAFTQTVLDETTTATEILL